MEYKMYRLNKKSILLETMQGNAFPFLKTTIVTNNKSLPHRI